MQDEKQRVKPLLERSAVLRVHELVLGHEQARQRRGRDVPAEIVDAGSQAQGQAITDKNAQRVQRVPDALPAR